MQSKIRLNYHPTYLLHTWLQLSHSESKRYKREQRSVEELEEGRAAAQKWSPVTEEIEWRQKFGRRRRGKEFLYFFYDCDLGF